MLLYVNEYDRKTHMAILGRALPKANRWLTTAESIVKMGNSCSRLGLAPAASRTNSPAKIQLASRFPVPIVRLLDVRHLPRKSSVRMG